MPADLEAVPFRPRALAVLTAGSTCPEAESGVSAAVGLLFELLSRMLARTAGCPAGVPGPPADEWGDETSAPWPLLW